MYNLPVFLSFLWGFFWSLPLSILPSFHGAKIDDMIMLILLFIFLCHGKVNIKLIAFLFVVISYSTVYLIFSDFDNDPIAIYVRIIQSMLLVLFSYFLIKNKLIIPSFKGVILGGCISLFFFFSFVFKNVDFGLLIVKGSYLVKDAFQYSESDPFSIHVNSISNLYMFIFFCSLSLYLLSKKKIYLYMSFVFLLVPLLMITKGVLIGIMLFFLIIYNDCLKQKCGNKYFIIVTISMIFILLSSFLFYSNVERVFNEYNINMSSRDSIYISALHAISDNLLGYGLDSQNSIIYNYSGINYPAHNFFLSLALEQGIIAFIISISAIFIVLKKVISFSNVFGLGVLVAFLFTGMFGNLLYFYKLHFFAIGFTYFLGWNYFEEKNISNNK
ncbi:TPA: O-antigen ligase family protein [Photobacterium damselae]